MQEVALALALEAGGRRREGGQLAPEETRAELAVKASQVDARLQRDGVRACAVLE